MAEKLKLDDVNRRIFDTLQDFLYYVNFERNIVEKYKKQPVIVNDEVVDKGYAKHIRKIRRLIDNGGVFRKDKVKMK